MLNEIKIIKIEDKNYPESLRKIPDAPKVLYYRGNFIHPVRGQGVSIESQKNQTSNGVEDELCFGIVGTRRPSPYGQQVTLQFAGELSDAGLTIVSGMAPGIDTFAHKICVEKGKRTIAVLGTGLDEQSIYPQQNLELSRKIIENGGCLISELPPGTHGSIYTFPKRNRIISGLSLGILVVEAKEKSGSLITAKYAKLHKKKIFAVPGQIFTLNVKGPHKLIKEGAKLVENVNDILEELGIQSLGFEKDKIRPENLEERLILNVLTEESLYIDKIIEKTKLTPSVVATSLALMEISGKIRNLGGNVYILK